MKVIVAPDSFKGCLPAGEVAAVVADSLRKTHPDWEVLEMPLADGGEGTLDVLLPALGGRIMKADVQDPLGRTVTARFGLSGETAVIEVAEACGLRLLSPEERNPLKASTYGVGELLLAARLSGVRHFLVGLGGSATCDGGEGMMQVPGLREALQGCSFELLCDVENPFIGPDGAARVFAPQKGASEADVEVLEERLTILADKMLRETGVDVCRLTGAGAAGGLGGAFMAYLGARRVSGIERVLELVRFDERLEGTDLIITGEGKSDAQTLMGKVPQGVLRHAKNIPVALLSGRIEARPALLEAGFDRLTEVSPRSLPMEEAMKPEVATRNLRDAALSAVLRVEPARKEDLKSIMAVLDAAIGIMRASGNKNQWINGYPSEEVVLQDIGLGNGYVVMEGERIVGYFAYIASPEPTYAKIYEGAWLEDRSPYHVVHRIGSYPEVHGVFRAIMDWCFSREGNIRIDTHRDNKIMQHNILKYGFSYCGIIYLLSGDERLAYQAVIKF